VSRLGPAGLLLALSGLAGCTIHGPPPPDLALVPPEVVTAPSTPLIEPVERAALLERLERQEAELSRWKALAAELRVTLEKTRTEATTTRELVDGARRAQAEAEGARVEAEARAAAAEQARRAQELEGARRELEAIRRERAQLEADLARGEPAEGEEQ